MSDSVIQKFKSDIIWSGRPSQLENFWTFVLLFWTIIFPLIAWLKTRFTTYELKSDRFFDRSGILFQKINQMELIRIRDYAVTRTLVQRIFGKGNLIIISKDETDSVFVLKWISDPENVNEIIRNASEKSKKSKGFFEGEVL